MLLGIEVVVLADPWHGWRRYYQPLFTPLRTALILKSEN